MNFHFNLTNRKNVILFLALIYSVPAISQKLVRYDLYIKDSLVNFAGKNKRAIAVNGQIPMPTLEFTVGDTAEIIVHNLLKESTSLHWHGLLLPNREDGVPYLTQMPIAAGKVYTYKFPIIQHGTHWYHSHSGLQEQIGMYGSMILHKNLVTNTRLGIDDLPTIPVIISEWTDLNPKTVHRMLHHASDWFALNKNAVQSYSEAIKSNHFKTKINNEWKRMVAMDVSDVHYDKILINGSASTTLSEINGFTLKGGDKIRLRISNAGASSYFWLRYAGGKITIVAHDGNDVEPIEIDRLILAVSETVDIILQVPSDSISYEFMATTEDRTNSASLFIGKGVKQLLFPLPMLNYFEGMEMMNAMMQMNGQLDDMGMQMSLNQMDMNEVMYPEISGSLDSKKTEHLVGDENSKNHMVEYPTIQTFNYSMLRATYNTSLPQGKVKTLNFELTGNMNRYVWSLNNKVVSESHRIQVNKGEILRLILHNRSMMRHPMHLHGHDFRLINGQGEFSPLKNVVDIMPMETDTLEFLANSEGDWFFHCHILYHMMSGMGRVFSYSNYISPLANLKLAKRKLYADDRQMHFKIENDFASNGNDGMLMFQNTRWRLGTEWRVGYNHHHGYETETHIGRYLGSMQWWMPFVGFDVRYRKLHNGQIEKNIFGQKNSKDNRAQFSVGFEYTIPMLIVTQFEWYLQNKIRIQLKREDISLSKRLRMNFMANSDMEFMVGIEYLINRTIGITSHYDSDMGLGFGLRVKY